MMLVISEMYITLLPAILAGVMNMVWCSLPVCLLLKKPMDNERCWWDGRRIFGDNKTWKGFIGMLQFGALFTLLWGFACGSGGYLFEHNYLYRFHGNTVGYNALMGLLFGLAYAVMELPNSFLKRRMGIVPGKALTGAQGIFFVFLDQADSVFGMVLVVACVYPMSLLFYLAYVLLGAATHIVANMLLYKAKLRKNMF